MHAVVDMTRSKDSIDIVVDMLGRTCLRRVCVATNRAALAQQNDSSCYYEHQQRKSQNSAHYSAHQLKIQSDCSRIRNRGRHERCTGDQHHHRVTRNIRKRRQRICRQRRRGRRYSRCRQRSAVTRTQRGASTIEPEGAYLFPRCERQQ